MTRVNLTKLPKWLLVACFVTAAGLLAVHFHGFATIRNLQLREAEFAQLNRVHPAFVIIAFMAVQVISLGLCIPGSVFSLALLGGALFGSFEGMVIVLVSVTIGDSLSFLVARFLLRDWVQRRLGSQIASVKRGIEADGPYYLLGMRLLPVLPFFVVNLTMGVTRMPLRVFAPLSFIGLAPSIALYVHAGTRLSGIRSRADVLSPKILIIFAVLAAFPIATHVTLKTIRRRRLGVSD